MEMLGTELEQKREEMLDYLEHKVYGIWRSKEQVTYELSENGKVRIEVHMGARKAEFTISYFCPEKPSDRHCGKFPFFVCLHPIKDYPAAIESGYACLVLDSLEIASDDTKHKGAFYDLYPYSEEPDSQTGVLMAWGWGASKVLDAVYAGLGRDLNLDCGNSLVTGVSRWGKAVAVLGVFDKRFKMVIPACSGAAGLALYSVKSTGKAYDLSMVGGPKEYVYGENEPLSCLQSEGERGWFVDAFLQYESEDQLPFDQDILPKLAAGGQRSYFIVAACMGEDWVNAPSMWECYLRAKEYYEKESLGNRLLTNFHKEGHAVLAEDFQKITKAFDDLYYPDWWVEKYALLQKYRLENEKVQPGGILFAGSSLMEMFPVEKFATEDGLQKTIYNRGIGGYVTEDLMQALDVCITDLQPSVLFINIGTNDLSNELISMDRVMENYEWILTKVMEKVPGVNITLMAYYPVNPACACDQGMQRTLRIRNNDKIREANQRVKKLAEKLSLRYIDVNEPITDSEGNLKQEICMDGMHMTEEGYRLIWPLVKKTL